jgi:hypothetical protein
VAFDSDVARYALLIAVVLGAGVLLGLASQASDWIGHHR